MIDPMQVTGLVLAGGMGRRMGGVDKGLQPFRGQPMIAWALVRLMPQVGTILINANRNIAPYESFGHAVVVDAIEGFAGPLAGFHTGLLACETDYLATVPCDSPFLPEDLVARLGGALEQADAEIAIARTGGRAQPVFTLMRARAIDSLGAFLHGGGRKIDAWYPTLPHVMVDFDDEPDAFANLNSLDELHDAEAGRLPRSE
jgi:molybdopterin-guanine dinucleotide biosynthesis protein A